MSRKEFGDYYLGLDIGTDSVGWAVTDMDYRILNFNGKAMWGVHLFDSGDTAEDRRTQRIARRRLERRKHRIDLLQGLFSEEMSKTDSTFTFFMKMDESRLVMEDRKHKHHDTLFNDPGFTDRDLHEKYPTIYHLRAELMESDEKHDIRLIYLACHHIIKYRGHFLFNAKSDGGDVPPFREVYGAAVEALNEACGTDLSGESADKAKEILRNGSLGMREKKAELYKLFGEADSEERTDTSKAFADLIVGSPSSLGKLFNDEDLKDEKLKFKNADFEEARAKLEEKLGSDKIEVLERAKAVYDSLVLEKIVGSHGSISKFKVEQFEQHRKDLRMLKAVLKSEREKRLRIFKSETEKSYSAYVNVHKKNAAGVKSCTQEDFCEFLRKELKDILADPMFESGEWKDMKDRIKSDEFMPKQVSKDNSAFPNSLHASELRKILEKASAHYPFLSQKDEFGDSVSDKIMKICTFRIPYYVGPLVSKERSERAWMVRREDGAITPWNFERRVDLEASEVGFIKNLINKCTYIPTEDVIPKESILYSRYMLHNEVNNLRVNGERIPPQVKRDLVRELFERRDRGKVTIKTIEEWLKGRGLFRPGDEIGGIDQYVKASLRTENALRDIIGDVDGNRAMAEDIVRTVTIFGDDPRRLEKKLGADYGGKLSEDQVKRLSKLRFKDWGRLSEKLLTGIRASVDGREMCIMEALEETNLNLMELLSDKYGFRRKIEELNGAGAPSERITYDMLDDLRISPPVKRGVWRSMSIIKDIVKITGHPPAKVFIETTRDDKDEKKRTESRLNRLKDAYKNCKEQASEFAQAKDELEKEDEGRLRIKNVYSYYCQNGRCMYCGKKIDLNDLVGNSKSEKYNLDHIYPASKKMDDSLNNNLVLVCESHNMEKSNEYPLKEEWQNQMKGMWSYLKEKGLITSEKYSRLVRTTPLSEDELAGFINRQLVETSQSVMAVIKVMEKAFGKGTEVVYVKANAVSDFRNGNNGYRPGEGEPPLRFVKCRSVNDYHHAKDAYLNIVVGNAYDTKFTKDPMKFVRSGEKYSLRLEKMLEHDIKSVYGTHAWTAGNDGTIKTVSKYMRRNNILFTRFAYEAKGELFDQNPVKKGNGQLPLKEGLPIEKYGGYNKVSGSYFALVEHGKGKKRIRTIQPVPVHVASQIKSNEDLERHYASEGLDAPKVLVPKILTFALMEIDGFRVHIAGRTNNNIIYRCAEQAILSEADYAYCKQIFNHVAKTKEKSGNDKTVPASDYGIDPERSLALYDALTEKYGGQKYGAVFKGLSEKLAKGREAFASLSPENQSLQLDEILHAFQCNAVYVDLGKIKDVRTTGMIWKSNNVANYKSIKIISQSPSGLFEGDPVDLKAI
jgi:CRISPR-associated endonuclease Csn1